GTAGYRWRVHLLHGSGSDARAFPSRRRTGRSTGSASRKGVNEGGHQAEEGVLVVIVGGAPRTRAGSSTLDGLTRPKLVVKSRWVNEHGNPAKASHSHPTSGNRRLRVHGLGGRTRCRPAASPRFAGIRPGR